MIWLSIHSIMRIIFSWIFKGTVSWSSCITELLKSLKVPPSRSLYDVLSSLGVLKFHSNVSEYMPFFIHLAQHFLGYLIQSHCLSFTLGNVIFMRISSSPFSLWRYGLPGLILFVSWLPCIFSLSALYSYCFGRQKFTSE